MNAIPCHRVLWYVPRAGKWRVLLQQEHVYPSFRTIWTKQIAEESHTRMIGADA